MKGIARITSINLILITLLLFAGCVYTPGEILEKEFTPKIQVFEVAPSVIDAGTVTYLRWQVENANSVSINNNIGDVAISGTMPVSPSSTTTYTITARNIKGTSSSSLTVIVNPGVNILTFKANPSEIGAGNIATLQWNVVGAESVTIEPGIGNVKPTGSSKVSPQKTTMYTLIAERDSHTVYRSVAVTVNNPPVVASFTVFPGQVEYGRSTLLRWNVSGANRVRIEPDIGEVPAAGNYAVIPGETTTYVLTAQSDCCVVSRSVVVNVNGYLAPPQGGPIVELFNITPKSIYKGDSAILQWDVVNARSVSIDQGIGTVPSSGSIVVTPSANTTYTLTVANEFAFYPVSIKLLVFEP